MSNEQEERIELFRCGPKGFTGVILSHDLIGGYTHFWRRRTVPCCDGEDCRACQAGLPKHWKGWLAVYDPKKQTQKVLEITADSTASVDEFFEANQTLRGALLKAYRTPERTNGYLRLTLSKPTRNKADLPEGAQVKEVLYRIWGKPSALASTL